jgi:biopolymer transport protein ExbD
MFNDRHSSMLLSQSSDSDDDLDLTNLIDLFSMLCALFMMLVSPLAILSSSLAEAPGDATTGNEKPGVVIRLSESGSLTLNDEPIEMDAIGTRLKEMQQATSFTAAFLAIDKDARYEPSRQLRAIVSGLGIRCDEVSRLPQE